MHHKTNTLQTTHFTAVLLLACVLTFLGVLALPHVTVESHAQTIRYTGAIDPETVVPGEFIVTFEDDKTPEEIEEAVSIRQARAETTLGRLRNQQEDTVLSIKGEPKPEDVLATLNAVENRFDASTRRHIRELQDTYVYRLDTAATEQDIEAVLSAYEDLPVKHVQPNYKYYLSRIPDDPGYNRQWGMPQIDAPKAWNITTGNKNVIVAVIDSGIDTGHPDLSQNVVKSVPIAQGCINNGDGNGHGTHVTGVIGAAAENGTGIAGLNWDITIYGYCVMAANGTGTSLTIAQGINQAVQDGADVVNMSLGGPIIPGQDQAIENAIQTGYNQGVTFIAAAGNCGKLPPGQYQQNPGCYWGGDADKYTPGALSTTINVAALGPVSEHPEYSNKGSSLDISAPGGNPSSGSSTCHPTGSNCILSTWDRNKTCPPLGVQSDYCPIAGTSMAAPHVAGVVALMKAVNPGLSPEDVRSILHDTADELGLIGKDTTFGYGRINALKAVSAARDSGSTPSATPSPTGTTDCVAQKQLGDYNCNGEINLADFEAWRQDYVAGRATLKEFEWFRAGFTGSTL